MSYTITLTNGNELAIVADGTVNTTASSINLVGKNYSGYGALIAENMVHQLENFANASAPATPLVGQLWYDTTTEALMVYSGSAWSAVGLTQSSSSSNNTGYTFNDGSVTVQETTADNAGFMLYDPNAPVDQRYYRIRVRDDGVYDGHFVLEALNDDMSVQTIILNTNSSGFLSLAVSPASSDNSTAVATTAYVQAQSFATTNFVTGQGYATITSPNFTGTPTAPTPTAGDNSNKLATTAYVRGTTRTLLTGPLNLYVATTGTDSAGWGLVSNSPFQTIQYAINYVYNTYDTQGNSVTINVADGTYSAGGGVVGKMLGGGTLSIIGDTTSPGNCAISLPSPGVCFYANNGGQLTVKGFSLTASSGSNGLFGLAGICLNAGLSGELLFDKMIFNAAQSTHIAVGASGYISVANNGATYTIAGGAQYHLQGGSGGGVIDIAGATITVANTPYFSGSFAWADSSALIYAPSLTFVPPIPSVTGTRYLASNGGYIDTNGGGGSYLPGNNAGSSTTGYYG